MFWDEKVTDIWKLYKAGKEHHEAINLYRETERNYNFYIGDQWKGALKNSKQQELPMHNIIKPIIKYKVAMIAKNASAITFSSMSKDPRVADITNLLNEAAKRQWEKSKMDTVCWEATKKAAIAGGAYVYWLDGRVSDDSIVADKKPKLKMRLVETTNIYFSDEQNKEINEQEWIAIQSREPVARIRREAKKNGCTKEQIAMIVSDEDYDTHIGENKTNEVKSDTGKCTVVLMMELTDEGLKFCRSTRSVVYQPEILIPGLDAYPIAPLLWETNVGTCRGVSGVKYIVPNQLSINNTLYRREIIIQRYAYPIMVYDVNVVPNPSKLTEVGATIGIDREQGVPVKDLVTFLDPAPITATADNYQKEVIETTQQLEGAGDAATGQIDPTQASGEAIKAARDQAAIPLTEQMAAYKQFIEDTATIWYKLWTAYSDAGMEIETKDGIQLVSKAELQDMDVDIKVDVSPIDPYSVMAEDNNLLSLLQAQHITFEEFVSSLSASTNLPKEKLEQIIKARMQPTEPVEPMPPELAQAINQQMLEQQMYAEINGTAPIGGMPDAMQAM